MPASHSRLDGHAVGAVARGKIGRRRQLTVEDQYADEGIAASLGDFA